jgi:hypothetical protein
MEEGEAEDLIEVPKSFEELDGEGGKKAEPRA